MRVPKGQIYQLKHSAVKMWLLTTQCEDVWPSYSLENVVEVGKKKNQGTPTPPVTWCVNLFQQQSCIVRLGPVNLHTLTQIGWLKVWGVLSWCVQILEIWLYDKNLSNHFHQSWSLSLADSQTHTYELWFIYFFTENWFFHLKHQSVFGHGKLLIRWDCVPPPLLEEMCTAEL